MCQQKYVGKDEIPIIARVTMAAMNPDGIRNAFKNTRIYPVNRAVITSDLLVGDKASHTPQTVTKHNLYTMKFTHQHFHFMCEMIITMR